MFIIENYSLAVVFCFITMLCWGVLGQYPEAGGQSCLAIRTLLLGLCNRCVTFVTSGCVYNGERRGIGTRFC